MVSQAIMNSSTAIEAMRGRAPRKRARVPWAMPIKAAFVLLLAFASVRAETVQNCQTNIYGCSVCQALQKNSETYHSCSRCDAGLYLYKHKVTQGIAAGETVNICVPGCRVMDTSTAADEAEKQCVFLGHRCQIHSYTTSSVSGRLIPTCQYSEFNANGFRRVSRRAAVVGVLSTTSVDPLIYTAKTVDELHSYAYKFFPPTYSSTNTEVTQETNTLVMFRCQQRTCQTCSETSPMTCQRCWGRFGDSRFSGACHPPSTCPGSDPSYEVGCYKARDDCIPGCEICDLGYSRQTSGKCEPCSSIANCADCEGSAGSLRCTWCEDGYGVTAAGACQKCSIGDNVKRCQIDGGGQETIQLCEDGYTLSSDGRSCVTHCATKEFEDFTTGTYGLSRIQCTGCDASCRTCVRAGAEFCTSCPWGARLTKVAGQNRGTCSAASPHSGSATKIFVKGLANDPVMAGLSTPGSYGGDRVAEDLLSGILAAYEVATGLTDVPVEILMETGTHVINQDHMDAFVESLRDRVDIDSTTPSVDLTIRPFSCSDLSQAASAPDQYKCQNYATPTSRTAAQQTVRVVSKVGQQLVFRVPQSLKMEDIHFDAADSVQPQVTDAMRSSLEQVCTRAEGATQPTCADQSVPLQINSDPICRQRHEASLFQFANHERSITDASHIQSLQILNCSFANFMYEVGSLIRLPQRQDQTEAGTETLPFSVEVKNSRFEGLSFCGSIISNDYPTFKNETGYMAQVTKQQQAQVARLYTQAAGQSVAAMTASQKYNIVFESNTIEGLYLAKRGSQNKLFGQKVPMQMQKLGLALHLVKYPGRLTISSNTFSDAKLPLSDACTYQRYTSSRATLLFQTAPYPWQDPSYFSRASDVTQPVGVTTAEDTYQLHSLVVLDQQGVEPAETISLDSNTFKEILLSSSLVSISKPTGAGAKIELKQNTFESVQSHLSPVITLTLSQSGPTAQADEVDVIGNRFMKVGSSCQQTEASVLTVQRNKTNEEPSYQNAVRQVASYAGSAAGTVTLSNNEVDLASVPGVDGGRLISVKHFSTVAGGSNSIKNVASSPVVVELTTYLALLGIGESDVPALTEAPAPSTAVATLLGAEQAATVSLTATIFNGVATAGGVLQVLDVGAAATTLDSATFAAFDISGSTILIKGTTMSSLAFSNGCQLSNINSLAFLLVEASSVSTLQLSGLTVQTVQAATFQLASQLTAQSITMSACVFDGVSASGSVQLLAGLVNPARATTSLAVTGTQVKNMAAPTVGLFQAGSAQVAVAITSSQFASLAGAKVSIFENENSESTIEIRQTQVAGVTMQGTDGFAVVTGGIKEIVFAESSVASLAGGAKLFTGSTSITSISVDGGTFQQFRGGAQSNEFLGFSGKAVTISNSKFADIADLQIALVEAESVEVTSTTVEKAAGTVKGINAAGLAASVVIKDSVFSSITNAERLIAGGTSALTLANVTVSGVTLASGASELVLMQSRSDSITGSTFDGISGPTKFDIITMNMLEAGGRETGKSTLQSTTFTKVCVKTAGSAAADGCSPDDDANLNTIIIKHPRLSPDRLEAQELSISSCSVSTAGAVVAYTSAAGDPPVSLPLHVTVTSLQASFAFLGLQNAGVRSLSVQGVTVADAAAALASPRGSQGNLYMLEVSGAAATSEFLIKDIELDFGSSTFDFVKRLLVLRGRQAAGQPLTLSNSLTAFKVDGFANRNFPLKLENIKVRNLNMSQAAAANLDLFTFMEVDSVSSVTMKDVSIRNVESASTGLIVKHSAASAAVAASLTKEEQPLLDLASITAENLISLQGTTGGLFELKLTKQHVKISDSSFQMVFGEGNTVFHAQLTDASVEVTNTQATNNVAMVGSSLGTISAQTRSTATVATCIFMDNEVVAGSSLLQVESNVDLSISDSKFTDNKASTGTHGIRVVPDKDAPGTSLQKPRVTIASSTFTFSAHPDAQAAGVNGAFIQISQIEGKPFAPSLVISGSTFRMGAAQRGGAIYYGMLGTAPPSPTPVVQSLTLQVTSSTFAYNTALQDGAAICLDNLNYQDLGFDTAVFEKNSAATSGDNIFARQTLRVAYAPAGRAARRLSADAATSAAEAQKRQLEIKDSRFESGSPRNQVHLEGLAEVKVTGSTFKDTRFGGSLTDEGLAFEGAGMYMRNVYQARLQSNTFEALAAKVRGGALMIKQDNATYFGQTFLPPGSPPLYGLDSNSFTGCSAQQGGAVYLSSVRGLAFTGTNTFTSNKALRAATIPAYISNNDQVDPIQSKTQLGQGPALFTDCGVEADCSVSVAASTAFSQSTVIDTASGTAKDETASSIYAVGEAPSVSAPGQTLGQYIAPTVDGDEFFLMTDVTEIEELKNQIKTVGAKLQWTAKTVVRVDNEGSQFRLLYNLDNFMPGSQLSSTRSHLFGDSAIVAVADDQRVVQVNDDRSTITFECNQTLLNPDYAADLPKESRCLLASGASFVSHVLEFKNGIVEAPKIFIDSLPNVSVYVKVKVQHLNTDPATAQLTSVAVNEVLLKIDMVKCTGDQIVNASGLCESCPGPSLYKRVPGPNAALGKVVLEECQACPDDIFRCDGGSKVTTLAGYNRLSPNTDEYIKCPMQGKTQPCLEGDKCIEGHEGVLCAQCQANYFMNSEGRCLKCSSGSSFARNFVLIILYWLIFIVIVITFVNVLASNQATNRLSTGTYLMKSIVNYIVYLAILTEVFAKYWIHHEPGKQTGAAKAVNELVAFARSVYAFPLALTIEMAQCQMFGEDIGNGVEVRKAGAYYAGAVLLSLVCLFGLLKLFRKVEYQKKQGEAPEIAEAENDEKQMAVLLHALEPDAHASANSRQNLKNEDAISKPASQGGPGRQEAASAGSVRNELARINPTKDDRKTEDQYKGEILSTLDRIGGQEQGIPDLVAQALKNKDGKYQTKSEKALAKSYEHLNALKARKLMLQRELTQYQDEVKLENQQQNSVLGSDDRGLLNDMDLADPKKGGLAAVNEDDVRLQNLSQDLQERKSFELEGGEEEASGRRRDAGGRPGRQMTRNVNDRANVTGSTGHEFTLARNEFNNTGLSDEKQITSYRDYKSVLNDQEAQRAGLENTGETGKRKDAKGKEAVGHAEGSRLSQAASRSMKSNAKISGKSALFYAPVDLKPELANSRGSQDPKNVTPEFVSQKKEREDEVVYSLVKPDHILVKRSPEYQAQGSQGDLSRSLNKKTGDQIEEKPDPREKDRFRGPNKLLVESMTPVEDLSAEYSVRSGVATNYPVGVVDGDYNNSSLYGLPAKGVEGGGLSEDTEGNDRSAKSLRGNARSALQHNNFMLEEKIDFNDAGENGRSKSPLAKPEREGAPSELRNNIRTIEVTTEHTMLGNNERQRPFNLEPRLDGMVAGGYNQKGARSPSIVSKRTSQANLKESAAKLSHQDGTNDSLQGRSRISENVDFRELSRNLQLQLFNFHKFEKLTLFMMIVHFLLNVQVMELIIAVQSCRKVERATFKGQQYDTGAFPIGKWLNTYDSSYECGESVITPALFFSVIYCAFWILLAPAYSLWRAWRLYLIESFGMIAKVLLLAVAKVLSKVNETQSVFLALLVVSIQLIIFVVLCQHQTLSQTEKLTKLNALNNVDLLMYVTLEVTCIIGMIDYLVDPEPESIGEQILMMLLMLMNCLYLFTWAAVSIWMLIRYTYHSPKLALLVLICSCGCVDKSGEEGQAAGANEDGQSTDRKKKSMQDLENQIKDQIKENLLVEQEKEREMQRIDVLLKHLINKQKQIQASLTENGVHAPGLTARSQSDASSMRGGMGASSYRGRYAGEQNKIILELQELLQEQNGKQDFTSGGGMGSQLQQSDIEKVNQLDSISNGSVSARGDPRMRSRSREPAPSRNTRDQIRSADQGPREDFNDYMNKDFYDDKKPMSPAGPSTATNLGLGTIGEEDHQQMLEAGNDTFAKSKAAPSLKIEENASSNTLSRAHLPPQPAEGPETPSAASMIDPSDNQGRSKPSLKTKTDPKSSKSPLESAVSGIISSLNTIDYQKQDSRSRKGRPEGADSSQSRPGAPAAPLGAGDGGSRIPGTDLGSPAQVAASPLSALSAPDPRRIAENQGQNEDFAEERGGRAASRTRDSRTPSDSNLVSASSRDAAKPAPKLAAVMSQLSDLQTKLHGKGKDSADVPRDSSPANASHPRADDGGAPGVDTRARLKQQLEQVAEMRQALEAKPSPRETTDRAAEAKNEPASQSDPVPDAALNNDYGIGRYASGTTNLLVPSADAGAAGRGLGARAPSQLVPQTNVRDSASANQRYRSKDITGQSRRQNPLSSSRASSDAHSQGADDASAVPQASKKEKQMQLMQAYTSLTQPELSAIKKNEAKDRKADERRSKSSANAGKGSRQDSKERARETAQIYNAESQLADPPAERKKRPGKSQERQRKVTKELKQKMQVIKELTARKKLLKEQENRLAFQ